MVFEGEDAEALDGLRTLVGRDALMLYIRFLS
jgi:hypothetical protein